MERRSHRGLAPLVAAVLLASPGLLAAQTATASGQAAAPAGTANNRAAGSSPARTAPAPVAGTPAPQPALVRPCTSVSVDAPMNLALGKSQVVRLDAPAARLVVGGQPSSRASRPVPVQEAPAGARGPAAAGAPPEGSSGVADTEITLLSPNELFLLGRKPGSMNVVVQTADGRCIVKDIVVTIDPDSLQSKLKELLPEATAVKVRGAESSLVLTGSVSDSLQLEQILTLAASYADARKIVNLLRVSAPQQVMLEVKIAEVSKSLLDRLGLDFSRAFTTGRGSSTVISGIIGGGISLLGHSHGLTPGAAGTSSSTQLGIDANLKDGVVRVLAEPNIMAISGQAASFLSGGKIFIPVAQDRSGGGTTITLEEKEFGVGLRFTPTVLDGRINLKIVSEVSELSQTGTPFTAIGGQVAVLPSMATRKVDTTVQLGDGQSFAVAGLIKNNVTEALNKFPGLGEAPVVGALFRSTEFQNDQTELMFVVTPRLVKPLMAPVALPTDHHVAPNRTEVLLHGSGEGRTLPDTPARLEQRPPVPRPARPEAPARPTSLGPEQPDAAAANQPLTAVPAPVLQATVTAVDAAGPAAPATK